MASNKDSSSLSIRYQELMSLEEASKTLLSHYKPVLRVETAPLMKALNMVLAVDIVSPIDVPSFDRASRDGYAVKAQDTFGADEGNAKELRLAFSVPVGAVVEDEVYEGFCAYVATGSAIPRGADAVVMAEYTRQEGFLIQVFKPVYPGENVVKAGSDILRGEKVLFRGKVLGPRDLGVLAAIGLGEVQVYGRPKIAIISTGSELTEVGGRLKPGHVYDVNTYTLAASVARCGGEPVILGLVPDDLDSLIKAIKEALSKAELVLVSGATSKGFGDILPEAIRSFAGSRIIVQGVRMKPGKPTIISSIEGKPLIGLPGNPTSALLAFNVLAAPLISLMAGYMPPKPRVAWAKAGVRIHKAKGRVEFKFVNLKKVGDKVFAYPMPTDSEAISTFAKADGYITIPGDVEFIDEGERVEVYML